MLNNTSVTTSSATKVIWALIDQLAQGLQKWVGWQDGDKDKCCLKGDKGESTGIGKKCTCNGGGVGTCCSPGVGGSATTCHQCQTCGTGAKGGDNKCYLSSYCKAKSTSSSSGQSERDYLWPTISNNPSKVHLLARIFLGSVCLIWSGLSQLGFLTKEGSGGSRWKDHELAKLEPAGDNTGLGSFMAAMGYDLERLNQGTTGEYCLGWSCGLMVE